MSRALRPDFTSTACSAIEHSITTPIIISINSVIFIVVGLLSLAMQSNTIYAEYEPDKMTYIVLYLVLDQGNKFYWMKNLHALKSSSLKSSWIWWRLCLVEFQVIMSASKNINCTYHFKELELWNFNRVIFAPSPKYSVHCVYTIYVLVDFVMTRKQKWRANWVWIFLNIIFSWIDGFTSIADSIRQGCRVIQCLWPTWQKEVHNYYPEQCKLHVAGSSHCQLVL